MKQAKKTIQNWQWEVPLLTGGTDTVLIHLGFSGREVIYLNGREISSQVSFRLKKSYSFELSDGQTAYLEVKANWSNFGVPACILKVNNREIQSWHTNLNDNIDSRFKSAVGILYFLGAINLLVGLVTYAFPQLGLMRLGFGLYNIIISFFYLSLGYVFNGQRSVWIGGIAFFLFLVDTFLAFYLAVRIGSNIGGGGIMRVFFSIILFRGILAARELEKKDHSTSAEAQVDLLE